jgi:hypothetical protein
MSVWRSALSRAAVSSSSGENHMGLPADFLIGADGRIIAVKYDK